jgi:hypothetical protein
MAHRGQVTTRHTEWYMYVVVYVYIYVYYMYIYVYVVYVYEWYIHMFVSCVNTYNARHQRSTVAQRPCKASALGYRSSVYLTLCPTLFALS